MPGLILFVRAAEHHYHLPTPPSVRLPEQVKEPHGARHSLWYILYLAVICSALGWVASLRNQYSFLSRSPRQK